ncbi:MAG: MerR family transcriptional regulator [Gammaproteobacteria bacterium]|jgi:MerR family mercuric resistance operon transcriptional regulator|nr:MerR family transcriptional regulator [Gammaproteobacteria bacterium]MBT3489547.1 MerR family transcriptional regulator [Gammaproteobacteria bacterium]MBT3845294.1 MerR family transcriptional regulator [Gammaproteobacteria bacterium]MBT3893867.1 MerR family transcriptional regulator [Gammaproteobacteria bacterium]MBT4299967.1 MerR family transcriptional regulator [Gammaproteobacteria bacterium]
MVREPTIGQVAKLSNCHVETIRYYQREGLIQEPPRPQGGGYRTYPQEVIQQLLFIRRAKKLGFSLAEIRTLLEIDGRDACSAANTFAQEKMDELEHKIEDLHWMRDKLSSIVNQCDNHCSEGGCNIITALQDPELKF